MKSGRFLARVVARVALQKVQPPLAVLLRQAIVVVVVVEVVKTGPGAESLAVVDKSAASHSDRLSRSRASLEYVTVRT